jgi:hypothetical protein
MTLNMAIAMADLIKKPFQLKSCLGGAAGLRSTFLAIRKPIKKPGPTQGPDLSSCALQHGTARPVELRRRSRLQFGRIDRTCQGGSGGRSLSANRINLWVGSQGEITGGPAAFQAAMPPIVGQCGCVTVEQACNFSFANAFAASAARRAWCAKSLADRSLCIKAHTMRRRPASAARSAMKGGARQVQPR